MMSRATILLCLLLAVYSLWAAAAPMIARVFGEGEVAASGLGATPQTQGIMVVDLGPALEFAPFGQADRPDAALVLNGEQSGFVLLGITTGQTQSDSRAIISGGDLPVGNFAIGSSVQEDVILAEVLTDHVVLSVRGQDQALYFPHDDGNDPTAVLIATPSGTAQQDTGDDETLLGRYRAQIQQDAPGLLQRLGIEATQKGYLVTQSASEEVLQAGLRPGDLVSAVNGKSLGEMVSDTTLLDEAAALGQASLDVVRDGKTILMTFPLN